MNEIKYPLETTYFISYDDNDININHGKVDTDQHMVTARANIFITTDENEYISELLKYGVKLDENLPE